MPEFIFMLTKDDRTVEDALDVYERVRGLEGLRYVGFKDVGLPFGRLREMAARIREGGQKSMLEVVSEAEADELRSARAALDLGVDYLLGGTHAERVSEIVAGSSIVYCPFPGRVVDHPSKLRGSVEEIVQSAKRLAAMEEVGGLDLLAYRHDTADPSALTRAVVEAVDVPVIAAGSVDDGQKVRRLADAGVWGFTVGSAIFDDRFLSGGDAAPASDPVRRQVERVLNLAGRAQSPLEKVALAEKLSLFDEYWSPKIVGELNGQHVKLAKFRDEFVWHHHEDEDEMFLVVKGRLVMGLRDGDDVVLDEGEFLIVPRGVEHKPMADGEAHVLLFEPASTLNTGNIRNERTVEKLERV
jgi:mannose-6-phosphate isomerase-like protein (cupin superfamily)